MKPLLKKEEEEDGTVALVVKPTVISEEEKQVREQYSRAQSRVKDVVILSIVSF